MSACWVLCSQSKTNLYIFHQYRITFSLRHTKKDLQYPITFTGYGWLIVKMAAYFLYLILKFNVMVQRIGFFCSGGSTIVEYNQVAQLKDLLMFCVVFLVSCWLFVLFLAFSWCFAQKWLCLVWKIYDRIPFLLWTRCVLLLSFFC